MLYLGITQTQARRLHIKEEYEIIKHTINYTESSGRTAQGRRGLWMATEQRSTTCQTHKSQCT